MFARRLLPSRWPNGGTRRRWRGANDGTCFMSAPIVVVISGQVSAGKTTAGKMLNRRGFQYARISQAIKTRWDGPNDQKPPRSWYQEMGMHLHRTIGQHA